MADVRVDLEKWREEYNRFRPHSSLGDLSSFKWLQSRLSPEKSEQSNPPAGPKRGAGQVAKREDADGTKIGGRSRK